MLYGVTGMLLYEYGALLQVLEGRPHEVDTIFASIERDPRHTDIKVVDRSEIAERDFGAWTMECNDLSGGSSQPLGHTPGALTRLSTKDARTYLTFYRPALAGVR